MNECWKKSEVAPGRVDDQNWQSAFTAALHLWEPRNQDQVGPRNLVSGTKKGLGNPNVWHTFLEYGKMVKSSEEDLH